MPVRRLGMGRRAPGGDDAYRLLAWLPELNARMRNG